MNLELTDEQQALGKNYDYWRNALANALGVYANPFDKRDLGGGRVVVEQATGACPASLRPPRASRLLRRLTPTFAIGQAF